MTAQFSDHVNYRGKTYAIAGQNGDGLFDPADHGIKTSSGCSACWRGFVAGYAVRSQQLLLDELMLFLDGPAPQIFGVSAEAQTGNRQLFDGIYRNLNHPVHYTGGLLLADDFIQELYVHMGFHPAWKYREVHELIFESGKLVQEADRSEQMAAVRARLTAQPLEPDVTATQPDIVRWIEECFSQKYDS